MGLFFLPSRLKPAAQNQRGEGQGSTLQAGGRRSNASGGGRVGLFLGGRNAFCLAARPTTLSRRKSLS